MAKERTTKRYSSIKRNCVNIDDPEFSRRPKEGHGFIYRYHFIKSGKDYIGQTIRTVRKRISTHISKTLTVDNMIRSGAAFTVEILAEPKLEYLDDAEIFCIRYFKTITPNGYNLTEGGQASGKIMTEESKIKLSESQKKRWAMMTDEQKKIQKKKMRAGVKISQIDFVCLETKKIYHSMPEAIKDLNIPTRSQTLSYTLMGKKGYSVFKGLHFILCDGYVEYNTEDALRCLQEWDKEIKSFESRNTIRKTNTKRKTMGTLHKYNVRCLENGMVFKGASEAGRYFNVDQEFIRRVIKGDRRTVKGYHLIIDSPYIAENPDEVLQCLIQFENDMEQLRMHKIKKNDPTKYIQNKGIEKHILRCIENNKIYPSLRQAALDLSLNTRTLLKVVRGQLEETHGYHFEKVTA